MFMQVSLTMATYIGNVRFKIVLSLLSSSMKALVQKEIPHSLNLGI